ncbi:MAG TPA: methionine biosynthesis protein MetW [Candidatus Paceibacterota bacterium]|nr:methionine biosynthesis protein MetW [Verrucomicrobiota bacterium]HRY47749.1 methionine biosynthesis protein MetW [Candidatus Paceibacterota bacterium]HSA02111.1 methionine biosynthesis protein MetW [Candidatus Paceibacterota bacterium]
MYRLLYDQVIKWIPEKSRVLDLGTGDGAFLKRLIETRQVRGEGVEKNGDLAARCIERGLVVHQGDILEGLDQYGLNAFDYVLLLGTFQELGDPEQILREAFRVGQRVVISYSNFAHWRIRLQLLFTGHSPVTRSLPSPWYRTPNLHFFSILDFQEFCQTIGIREIEHAYFNQRGCVRWRPNLRGELGLSLLEANDLEPSRED